MGRNVAEVIARLGSSVTFLSSVGNDAAGREICRNCDEIGVGSQFVKVVDGARTGIYHAVEDSTGDLLSAVADMTVIDSIDELTIRECEENIRIARAVFVDCNLQTPAIREALSLACRHGVPTIMDPVSIAKSARVCSSDILKLIDIITPNMLELAEMASILSKRTFEIPADGNPKSETVDQMLSIVIGFGLNHVIVTHGKYGAIYGYPIDASRKSVVIQRFAALEPRQVVSTNGCGDSFVAGLTSFVARAIQAGKILDCDIVVSGIKVGLEAAKLTIETSENIPKKEFEKLRDWLSGILFQPHSSKL